MRTKMNILNNLAECIGNTPLVRLSKINDGKAEIIAKIEFFNPAGSIKDRVALAMIEDAERRGILKPGGTIIEATSGNTGIGLALVAAIKGYKLIIVMPDNMSVERRKVLRVLGAEIVLTPGSLWMQGSIDKAEELHANTPGSFIPRQFENPANPECHKNTTAEEIIRDTDGKLDVFIAGVGSGGTISGVGEALKKKVPGVEIIAVEPEASPVLTGGKPGPHKITGIGANFIPKNYRPEFVDRVEMVSERETETVWRLAGIKEGLFAGISAGAILAVALRLSRDPAYKGKRIIALLADTGERYLSVRPLD